jgi:hypothetical protein
MAKDTITGISIGGKTSVEGRRYRATFSMTGNQLTISVANRRGSLVGQFVTRGKVTAGSGSRGIADDFLVKQVVESSRSLRRTGGDLMGAKARVQSRFSFNQAYQQVTRWSGPLPAETWRWLSVREQSSSSVITGSHRELGPFVAALAGE